MKLKNGLMALIFATLNVFSLNTLAATVYDYNFNRITTGAIENIGGQLAMEISLDPLSPSSVSFRFLNNVGINSSITDIYFDQGSSNLFRSISMYADSDVGAATGVVFDNQATPSNLPSGSTIGFTADFSGDSANPAKGVDKAGEWVTYMGILNAGKSFNALIEALRSGNFMVGLHVQAIGQNGQSDSFVNQSTVSAVPLPAAAWLFGSALLGFVTVSNRRRV